MAYLVRLAFVSVALLASAEERRGARTLQNETRLPVPGTLDTASGGGRQERTAQDQEMVELIRWTIQQEGLERGREVLREMVAALADPESGREPDHIAFLIELDQIAEELGSLEESRHLRESVLRLRSRLLAPDHPDLLEAKESYAAAACALGDLEGSHELFAEVLAARTRLLPRDDHDTVRAMLNLAVTSKDLGDLEGARALEEEVHEIWTRLLPSDDRDLLRIKHNLAVTRHSLGDLEGARELHDEVLPALARLVASDHPDLMAAMGNSALTRRALGDLHGALELQEAVLAASIRRFPDGHGAILTAKLNLASTVKELGDVARGRELAEQVLEARSRLLASDHPDLLSAKKALAAMRHVLADHAGAQVLYEEILRAREHLSPDHPELLDAKMGLAASRRGLGDLAGALALFEEVLATRMPLLARDHPSLLAVKMNLALTKADSGDLESALALLEEVHVARAGLLAPDHPSLIMTKQGLASIRRRLGNLEGARDLEVEVHEAWARLLPPDHPHLLGAKQDLAVTLDALGDHEGANEVVSSLLGGIRGRARVLRADAARPARECARTELQRLSDVLFVSASSDAGGRLEAELLATLEELRIASVASPEAALALAERPDLTGIALEISQSQARLNDLVAGETAQGQSVEEWRARLLSLVEKRDRAQRELSSRLAAAGVFDGKVEAGVIGSKLASGAVAVSYFRYRHYFEEDPTDRTSPQAADWLLAFLVLPGGAVQRVELGPIAELEELVRSWRSALGGASDGRGIRVAEAASGREELESLGARLRARVLDPILARAGAVQTLHVVLDDLMYLVPLDALPLEGGLVGEHFAIGNEITLARLLRSEREVDAGGGLTLAGGIDYDAELGAEAVVRLDASTPPLEVGALRSGPGGAEFRFLPGTTEETRAIAALYREAFEQEAQPLAGAAATKAALFAAAPKTRFLHLATHGWFAPETFRSQLETLAERGAGEGWLRAEETLAGFAPETLCGLALAGANRGRDPLGRVPGILTAEELATFDLRQCDLAVLSACETNVGIRRAGQGIQSLQAALHGAGVRTAITSLWKVDDAATQRLFELFYTNLWKEELGKAEALWQAKKALRAEGHPLRDWAGWVLSGDPQ